MRIPMKMEMAAQSIPEIAAAPRPHSSAPGQGGMEAVKVFCGGAAFRAQLEHSSLPPTVRTQLLQRGLLQESHGFRLSQSVSGQHGQVSTPAGRDESDIRRVRVYQARQVIIRP
jgi:hypothetical protein